MLKRRFLAAILATATAISLVACGGGAASSTAPAAEDPAAAQAAAPAAAPSGDGVHLDLWHYFQGAHEVEALERVVGDFSAANNLSATVTYVAREDLLKQYTMGALSGELPDVGMVDNPDHASFSAMGVFQDITDLLDATGERDKYFEGPLLSCMLDGRVYGLPNNSNCLALFYNKAMFAEKGVAAPPTTWDELLEVCAQVTDPANGVYGIAISAVGNEEGTFQFMPWFLSAGGDIADLDGENTVRALEFIKGLIDAGYTTPDVINFTQSDANVQFINGQAAMQINGPWNVPAIEADAPDLDYGIALMPKDKVYASVLGGENFAVCAGAPLEEAFKLLHYICSEEVAADFCESSGKFPPRSDSLELRSVWTDDPIMSVFGEQLNSAMPRGPHPRWPEISTAMSTAMAEVLTGTRPAAEALADAAATYDEIMAG